MFALLTLNSNRGFSCPKGANGMTNSADQDHTATSSRSSLIRVCTVSQDLSVHKLKAMIIPSQMQHAQNK